MFDGHCFTREELACLPRLRFLRVKESDFSGNFENLLSELRWLSWQIWQTTFHAKNFHFSNLVVLDLSDSNIEDGWDGWSQMKMDRLKVLDLTGCIWIRKTPDFSNFMSLEKLILARCVKLTTIDRSIGKLKHLTTLNIKGCSSLGELPEEVGDLQSLTEVIMPETYRPFNLPDKFGNLECLSSLILDGHLGNSQIPSYIGGLVKVTRLSLRWCMGIEKLPCSLGKMEMLVELDLSMSGVVELPDSIGNLKRLKVIRVSYTMIRKFPRTIGQVEMLEELHAQKCWDLTDENLEEIGKLSHLKILDLSYTHVSRFPTVLGCLSRLLTLELGSSDLQGVPELPSSLTRLHMQARQFPSILNLSSLVNLDYLELSRLTVSREEPDPSGTNNLPVKELIHTLPCGLSTLKYRGIRLLPPLSNLSKLYVLWVTEYPMPYFSLSQGLVNLTELKLSKCKFLEKIYGLPLLKNLQRLDLNRLDRLVEIQDLSELESLLYLRISDCYRIKRLPNLSKLDKLQHIELKACPKIKAIEGIKGVESSVLDNRGCTVLERLLDVSRSTWLSRKVPECQVFLSFSGPDTCYSIIDVLYKNLVRNQISVFWDDDVLSSGDGIGEELPQALDDSQIYIPFLSKNYASSWWCLRELAYMVKCTSKSYGSKIILPIFYDVEVDDVKLESTLYRSALDKHRWKFGNEVEEWEMALREVADIRAFNLNRNSHGELLELVLRELRDKQHLPRHLVEDHPQIKAIMDKLDVDSGGVRFMGIYGMGGIGKTTLAKVVFDKLSSHFEGVSFLNDIRESSQHGLVNLQKKLLSRFVGSMETDQIEDIGDGMKWIKRVCSAKKVFIVLDGLDKKEQLEKLAGKSNWFGSGSRILITTRDKSTLMTQVESSSKEVLNQPKGILAYEVHEMKFAQALQLFCKHAFKRDSPKEGYENLAKKVVRRVGMLPLAVVEIGLILCLYDKIEEWEDQLKQLNKSPLKVVRNALMISYEGLKDEEKEIFLDIACFFTNKDQTYPVIMWDDCNYCPQGAIHVLLQQSLIKIRDNKFWMHNQLQDLGRHIVQEEYDRKFSRVWIHEDAIKLLERRERNQDVEALSLTSSGRSSNFAAEVLASLPMLRFLQVKGLEFCGDFTNLCSELRWLSWQTWQTTFHGENFHFSKLVVLDLSNSNIEDDWVGWSQMKINKLKVLDLTDCIRLKTTPDFSNFTSLEKLILARCAELTTIHNSIGKLNLLKTLNIKGCSSLGELPAEIGSLQSLTEVIMPQNIYPFKLPETFGDLQSLSSLILDEHPGISQLPNSIGGLVKVKRLSVRRCVGITKLPRAIGKMKWLEELDLSKSGIVELPDSIGCLKELKVIRVSYTVIRKFPCTIGQVEMLEELHAKKCWDLTDENLEEIRKLYHLRILDLSYTKVSKFPTVRGCLSSLQTLEMSSIHLPKLPYLPPSLTRLHLQACHFPSTLHITSLVSLDYLELSRLSTSTEEPGPIWTSVWPEERLIHSLPSGLSTLKFRGISLLPPLSNLEGLSILCVIECPMSGFSVSKGLIHLKELTLSKCKFLEKISGLSLLKKLERLDFNRLESLVEIDGLSELESLVYFRISHCGRIERLPGLSKLDKLGHIELEACPKIRAIEGLESLELNECGCTVLKRLIDVSSSTWLSHRVLKNHVFLSFTGADACYSIVDCLCNKLVHNQILVFRDDEEMSTGDGVGEDFSLDTFVIYIPFLSKNYASSGWRLRELAHMVECTSKSNGTKKILPIFYDVEVDDVKLESDLYRRVLANHRRKFGNEVEEWEKALREVAGMKRFDLKTKSPGELDLVVEEVLCKLNAKREDVPENLVGILPDVNNIIKELDVNSGGVRLVGIWGMPGVGKTTHAKAVFNHLLSHFDGACFLSDLGESSQHGLINLQKKLLSDFMDSVIADQIEDIEVGMNMIKRACESRKVLIVLDYLNWVEQIENLAGKSDWFGSGSRIIITTRDPRILKDQGIWTLEVRNRSDSEAFELFCRHAFKGDPPTEEYYHLAKEIVMSGGGHPLLYEVIGSYLYCHCSQLEPHGDKRKLWEDTLRAMSHHRRKLFKRASIYEALLIGYAGLDDKQKEIFLDIACFFNNEEKKYPFIMWDDCSYDPESEISVLLQRSLIQIRDNKFWMHDMLQELGWDIVWNRQEYLCGFSKVWVCEDALNLFERGEGIEEVKALGQGTEEVKALGQGTEEVKALSITSNGCFNSIASEELAALPRLRFLRVKGIDFSGNFKNLLSELRWLSWQTQQATFLAYNFHFNKLLVLDLSHSNIEDVWGGWSEMKMNRLKVLDLTGCRQLTRTPDFSNFLTLEELILARCVRLTAIDSSIGKLNRLKTLNLEGCRSLEELPEEVHSLETHIIMPPHL